MKERRTQRGKENGSAPEFRSEGPEGEFKTGLFSNDGATLAREIHQRDNGVLFTLKKKFAYYSPSTFSFLNYL